MTTIHEFPHDWYQASSASFYLRSRSQISQRPWTGGKSVYGPHAQIWVCKMTLIPQERPLWQAISAFFSRLDGQARLVRISAVGRIGPMFDEEALGVVQRWSDNTLFDDGTGWQSGLLPPTLFVAAATTRGADYLTVGGLPVSTSRALRRGDLLEVKPGGIAGETPNLYEVQIDSSSDAAGKTGFEIRPRLRQGLAAGDQVSLRFPSSVFQCVDDDQGAVELSSPVFGSLGFTLMEAL